MRFSKFIVRFLACVFVFGSLNTYWVNPVEAQTTGSWSSPQWIPGLIDSTFPPVFVEDPNGVIHVFNSQLVNDQFTIVYSQWIFGVGWTKPVDILIPPSAAQARLSGALIDDDGLAHLFFWSGNEIRASIYYTSAPYEAMGQATAWETPYIIGPSAIEPTTAEVVGDGKGFMSLVYSGKAYGRGLYSVTSHDGGENWDTALQIHNTFSGELWPVSLRVYLSKSHKVFAVWSDNDYGGLGRTLYFASSDALAEQWSEPVILAEPIAFEVATPSIVEYNDELFVIYHNAVPTTRWMRRSSDEGKTWTSPKRLFDQVGSNGAAALVVDGENTLHMFFGNRVGGPAVHGLWHSTWLGEQWSAPQALVSGPLMIRGEDGGEGFDPSYAKALFAQGNLLMVAWRHDPQASPTHVWYSYLFLDLPEKVRATPTVAQADSTSLVNDDPLPGPSPSPEILITQDTSVIEQDPSPSPINGILLGVAPVFLIVLAIIFFRGRR